MSFHKTTLHYLSTTPSTAAMSQMKYGDMDKAKMLLWPSLVFAFPLTSAPYKGHVPPTSATVWGMHSYDRGGGHFSGLYSRGSGLLVSDYKSLRPAPLSSEDQSPTAPKGGRLRASQPQSLQWPTLFNSNA